MRANPNHLLTGMILQVLSETNASPENWWLDYDPFLLEYGLFSGAEVCSTKPTNCDVNRGNGSGIPDSHHIFFISNAQVCF